MRRLLTGYAIWFNCRHKRRGYLYQNRYKSILCQEEEYFLELVRYIHLNPVRGGIIEYPKMLKYRWTGHSAIIGKISRTWQSTEEVLSHFGEIREEATKSYRDFVRDGVALGRQEHLTGGGLRRSAGGWAEVVALKNKKVYWRSDERILGDGAFVEEVLEKSDEILEKREKLKREGWNLQRLSKEICKKKSLDPVELKKKGRNNGISTCKALISYIGHRTLGISRLELSRFFGISGAAVTKNIEKGEQLLKLKDHKLLSNLRPL